jgi:hypothetical protein
VPWGHCTRALPANEQRSCARTGIRRARAAGGIGIAFLAGVLEKTNGALQHWAETYNPFYAGPNANLPSVLPFAALTLVLLLVGREKLLGGPKRTA